VVHVARNDGSSTVGEGFGGAFFVQPETGFALRLIGTMAVVAIFRKDGLDVPAKIQRQLGGPGVRPAASAGSCNSGKSSSISFNSGSSKVSLERRKGPGIGK
jgi:hypothetical protein